MSAGWLRIVCAALVLAGAAPSPARAPSISIARAARCAASRRPSARCCARRRRRTCAAVTGLRGVSRRAARDPARLGARARTGDVARLRDRAALLGSRRPFAAHRRSWSDRFETSSYVDRGFDLAPQGPPNGNDPGLGDGATYYYRVRAYDDDGRTRRGRFRDRRGEHVRASPRRPGDCASTASSRAQVGLSLARARGSARAWLRGRAQPERRGAVQRRRPRRRPAPHHLRRPRSRRPPRLLLPGGGGEHGRRRGRPERARARADQAPSRCRRRASASQAAAAATRSSGSRTPSATSRTTGCSGRSAASSFEDVAHVEQPSFADKTAPSDELVSYRVIAVDADGLESAPSAAVEAPGP